MASGFAFAGVEVHSDGSIRYQGMQQDTVTCHAVVESIGAIRDRSTATRVIGGALLAGPVGAVVGGLLKKRTDDREVYLLITGERHDWLVPVRPAQSMAARQFAAQLNSAAKARADLEARHDAAAEEGLRQRREMEARRAGVYRPGLQ